MLLSTVRGKGEDEIKQKNWKMWGKLDFHFHVQWKSEGGEIRKNIKINVSR